MLLSRITRRWLFTVLFCIPLHNALLCYILFFRFRPGDLSSSELVRQKGSKKIRIEIQRLYHHCVDQSSTWYDIWHILFLMSFFPTLFLQVTCVHLSAAWLLSCPVTSPYYTSGLLNQTAEADCLHLLLSSCVYNQFPVTRKKTHYYFFPKSPRSTLQREGQEGKDICISIIASACGSFLQTLKPAQNDC